MDEANAALAYLFVFWLLLCAVAGYIAHQKGRWGVGFFLLAFFLSPVVGILCAFGAAPGAARAGGAAAVGPTRACPYCAEPIKAQAVLCRYCGRDVPPRPESREEAIRSFDYGDPEENALDREILQCLAAGILKEAEVRRKRPGLAPTLDHIYENDYVVGRLPGGPRNVPLAAIVTGALALAALLFMENPLVALFFAIACVYALRLKRLALQRWLGNGYRPDIEPSSALRKWHAETTN